MKNNLLDEIIIWSDSYIRSIRFNYNINGNFKNTNNIFNSIFNFIKLVGYKDYVMILNKNMYMNKKFKLLFKKLKLNKDFTILQLGVDNKSDLKIFDKIYSIGAFIINLKKIDLINFIFDLNNLFFENIIASNDLFLMHPFRYKKYFSVKEIKVLNNYIKFDGRIFKKDMLTINRNYKDPLSNNNNHFNNISQVYVSDSLKKFSNRIKLKYNLVDYNNLSEPCLFFGLYNSNDIYKLSNHKGKRYVLWGGSDADKNQHNHKLLLKLISEIKIDHHFAISLNIKKRLFNLGFNSELINFNLVDNNLFKPVNKVGSKIYIYNGNNKGREDIYGEKIYKEVIKRIPEFEYIFSNQLNKNYEEMPSVYSECFIGLRLTSNDGNANTVQEMNAMNIPVIHNGSEINSLSWDDVNDVELRIRYRNIDIFNDSIKNYKKILFFCTDYPGYGGASTNTIKMINYYKKLYKNIIGVFFTKEDIKVKFGENIFIINDINEIVKFLYFKPDLIILRNFIEIDIGKYFKCPVYFLIPGIFKPTLDKYYYEIKDKNEMDKYIHKSILQTIRRSDKSFCASAHTRNILKKYYNLDVNILFFNYISYYNKFINYDKNFENRKYEYGVVVSNFNRKVKNLDNIIDKLKLNNKKKILIGLNSISYSGSKIRTIELISNNLLYKYYKDIKYIIQDSFYESCSNVYVESRFCGCKKIGINDIIVDSNINLGDKKTISNNKNNDLIIINSKKKYDIKILSNLSMNKNIIKLNDNKSIGIINNYINNLFEKRNLIINIKKRKYKSIFKVLYFINIDYFIRKMSRVRFHSILKLLEYNNIILYLTGPGWYNYDDSITMENNINNMNINFDFVILYKPLDKCNNINKKTFKKIKFLKCIRYNEMWDERWTKKEINTSSSNLIICHHYNDYLKYKDIYKNDIKRKFIYNPHHANPDIFYDYGNEREFDILLAGKSTVKHYPLRYRLFNLIYNNKNTRLKKYKIYEHNHPGYNNDLSFQDIALIDYSKNINKCYLCIGGTSKYNYRLGKYVEISMCGSLILGDLPYEDKERLKKFVIVVDNSMSDDTILNIICKTLDNKKEMKRKMILAKQWAQNFTTEKYCKILVDSMKEYKNYYDNYII